MDDTGEQLHPGCQALATVHVKRFIKEGTDGARKGNHFVNEKYKISGVGGDEIKEFYEELVTNKDGQETENLKKSSHNETTDKSKKREQHIPRRKFEVRSYFQFAIENKVQELRSIDFEGIDINVCDNYGWSALMIASCAGAYGAVEFLLALGVDKNIKDRSGKTAKDLAYKKRYFKIVQLLEDQPREFKKDPIREEETERHEPFYCEICKQNFKETSKSQHYTSTVHQFNKQSNLTPNKLQKFNISECNKGLQMMVKQGWDKQSGLGPSQSGRLYPVLTVIRKHRTGLGIKQEASRITHFKAYDRKAVQRHSSDYYKKKPKVVMRKGTRMETK